MIVLEIFMQTKEKKQVKLIMIMIDGFGVPPEGWHNSVYSKFCSKEFLDLFDRYSKPIDACLGVDGLPQSATGQTALFSGVNAPEIMGGHIPAFPGPRLQSVIRDKNIFKSLIDKGLKVTFANSYARYGLDDLERLKLRSVTTIMTGSTLGHVRQVDELVAGDAVYHDLTRFTLHTDIGVGEITPEKAAEDLLFVAKQYDFTLFEYFMTDIAGHKRDVSLLKIALRNFSRFLVSLSEKLTDDTFILLCSDHGNCEDITVGMHTRNKVPLFLYKDRMPGHDEVTSIMDVYDYIVSFFK